MSATAFENAARPYPPARPFQTWNVRETFSCTAPRRSVSELSATVTAARVFSPSWDVSPLGWFPSDRFSFPSGHALNAFAIGSVLAVLIG